MRRGEPLRRRKPLRPQAKKATSKVELQAAGLWRRFVLARGPWLKCQTEHPGDAAESLEAHHVIPQQTLRSHARLHGLTAPELLWDPRVGVAVSGRRHDRHHSGHEPIRRAELPPDVFEFAEQYGLGWYIDRHYPATEGDGPCL